jgi:hypothetical protein
MKNLIILVGIVLAIILGLKAKNGLKESQLKKSISDDNQSQISFPVIPKMIKKSTNIAGYSKIIKKSPDYEKLSSEKQRQFDYQFLRELFEVTRKSPPTDSEISTWMNALEQGSSREGIYQALVLDSFYNNLESLPQKSSENVMSFCMKFSQKFLLQTFNPESLTQLNPYSLKRIFTEKGLDLLDYYESTDLEQLYRWYAFFSAQMAKDYRTHFVSDLRQNSSVQYHYEWALKMPIQHIKSEFIIKMHLLMNHL